VLVELLTLGTLSRLFKNLPSDIRTEICRNKFGKINDTYIGNWLQGCTILRNICAHRGRLYNRQIPFSLRLDKKDRRMLQENGILINRASKQLFVYLHVMRKIVPDEIVWNNFTNSFIQLTKKYPFVRLDYYGFPDNWKEILGIEEPVET